MQLKYIDSHSHLDFSAFDDDRSDALHRAQEKGVVKIVVSATVANRWNLIKVLADKNPMILPAYGLHPMFMGEHKEADLDQLKHWLATENAVAIGEIGLDYFIPDPDKKSQLDLFCAQLDIATEFNLPVIIHARKSLDIVLREIRKRPALRGSIHSFSGSEQQAKQLIDLGFYLGFGGPITYTRAKKLRRLISLLPLDAILLETDAPDQPDCLHCGERNEPAFLPLIAKEIAEIRHIDLEEVSRQAFKNTKTLFNI